MADLLHTFTRPFVHGGHEYIVEVHAQPYTENLWEGWVDFVSLDGGARLRAPHETTQPNREAVLYWAEGLSTTYLEGAWRRAQDKAGIGAAEREPERPDSSENTESSDDAAPIVERLYGHGIILRDDVRVGEADYDLIVTPPELRGTGATFEAGLPGTKSTDVPDISGRLLAPLYAAEPYAEHIHTLVLEDGRALDFRVIQPDSNEIVGVSFFRPATATARTRARGASS